MRQFLATFLILCLASPGVAVGGDETSLDSFIRMMNGAYRSDPTLVEDPFDQMTDRRISVSAPALGSHVMYLQINTGPEQKLYRQRLLAFSLDPETGRVLQETWAFVEPESFTDALSAPDRFETIAKDELKLVLPEGCGQVWTRNGDGWEGIVDPENCRMWSERRQTWRRIGAESLLMPNALWQAERGFDDQGEQVFGTPPGEYHRLNRID